MASKNSNNSKLYAKKIIYLFGKIKILRLLWKGILYGIKNLKDERVIETETSWTRWDERDATESMVKAVK